MDESVAQKSVKQPYSSPKLTYFGKVKDLTESGSGNASESAASANCVADRKPHPPDCGISFTEARDLYR